MTSILFNPASMDAATPVNLLPLLRAEAFLLEVVK